MGILSRAGDLVYTFRFLKLLTTSWEDMSAFKLGLIDAKGKRVKTVDVDTSEKKSAYTAFHKLVFNIKRLIPAGKFGSYASALFLLKEKYGVDDYHKILKECGMDALDFLHEETTWFLMEEDVLIPGVYRLKEAKMINDTHEETAVKGDRVRVSDDAKPLGDVLGLNIYEATHLKTNKKVYITIGELLR
jgi:hypothetical protein